MHCYVRGVVKDTKVKVCCHGDQRGRRKMLRQDLLKTRKFGKWNIRRN